MKAYKYIFYKVTTFSETKYLLQIQFLNILPSKALKRKNKKISHGKKINNNYKVIIIYLYHAKIRINPISIVKFLYSF